MAKAGMRHREAASQWLAEHGEQFEKGNTLKVSATDLAESAPQVDGRACSKKGGINLRKVAEVLEEYGMDPTVEIVKVLPELDDALKAKVMLELLQYTQPKLRSVEVSGKNGGPIEGNVNVNVGFVGTK